MHVNTHYTRARKVRRGRLTGVYVTHTARRLRRQRAYRTALTRSVEIGKDVAWGGAFFIAIMTLALGVIIGGLALFA